MSTADLKGIDLELTMLVDNYTDLLLLQGSQVVKRGAVPPPNAFLAEHGFSCLIKTAKGGEEHVFLMDVGISGTCLLHNADILKVDLGKTEALILSHGHFDHFYALGKILDRLPKGIPVILHPEAFLKRRINIAPLKMQVLRTVDAVLAELEKPDRRRFLSAAKASYKIPSLRNIELTGPFMHNGGMATLDEVLEFYIRGGNFETPPKEFGKIFALVDVRFSTEQREDLLNFLKSLTDERVRFERAPFDHPELLVPHGHAGNNVAITEINSISEVLAADEFLLMPAVGAEGRTEPVQAFDRNLKPQSDAN